MDDNRDSISTPLKYIALGLGAAFLHGAYRSFNLAQPGNALQNALLGISKPIGQILEGAGTFIPKGLNDGRVLTGSILDEVAAMSKVNQTSDLRNELLDNINKKYGNTGSVARQGELTVNDLLASVDRSRTTTLRNGNEVYESSLGLQVNKTQFDVLHGMHAKGDFISGDTLVDPGRFMNADKTQTFRAFSLRTLKEKALSLQIPIVGGNPLDTFLHADEPVTAQIGAEYMASKGYGEVEGIQMGRKLYRRFADNTTELVSDNHMAIRRNSSAGKAELFANKALRTPDPYESGTYLDPKSPTGYSLQEGLVEKGYYDHPALQALAEPILNNRFVKSVIGEQSFVYNTTKASPAGIVPLTAKFDMLMSKVPILKNFSARYAQHENIISNVRNSAIESIEATRERLAYVNKQNGIMNDFGRPGGPTKVVRKVGAQGGNLAGTVSPDAEGVAYNRSVGRRSNNPMPSEYVTGSASPGSRFGRAVMQGVNTTVGLLDAATGIGIAPMGPAGVMATVAAGAAALYLSSDILSTVDYATEKLNPFGDVGIKKVGLYMYAAARTAQQYALNFISPIFAPLEDVAPGAGDSLAGLIGKAVLGAVLGGKIGKLVNPSSAMASMFGKLAGAAFLGSMEMNKSGSDRWDEYTGDKLVAIRENRFWGLGPQDWRGGDIKYYRKSLIANELSGDKYKTYGGHAGYLLNASTLSLPTRMVGGITGLGDITGIQGFDPYALEKKNYYNQPYPLTGSMFENAPIVGPLLGATVGQMFKPTKIMHTEEMRRYYQDQATQASELSRIASELGIESISFKKEMPRTKGLIDALGETTDNLMDFFGMRGYVVSTAKELITGDKTFAPEGLVFKDSGELTNFSKRYGDMELGGGFGATEFVRRILTQNRHADAFNPMDPNFTNPFYHFDRVVNNAGNPYDNTFYKPESGITSDPFLSWKAHRSDKGAATVPYLFSKLYGNKTPLQAYKDKVTSGADFYNWSDPYESIMQPYLQSTAGSGTIAGAIRGGAFALLGRTAASRFLLGAIGSGVGATIGSTPAELSDKEINRRDTEQLYDTLEYKKIELLSETAKGQGRGDISTKLYKFQSKTMTGLDYTKRGQSFLNNAYAALPKADRRYLMDFANAPKEERQAILDNVPEYMNEVLQHVWSNSSVNAQASQAKAQAKAQAVISRVGAPNDSWVGYNPGVDLNKVKLASVYEAGRDVHDYGFWGSDERDYKRNYSFLGEASTLPNIGSYGNMMSNLNSSYGMTDFKLDVGPNVVSREDFHASYQRDRSETIMQHMTNKGRY